MPRKPSYPWDEEGWDDEDMERSSIGVDNPVDPMSLGLQEPSKEAVQAVLKARQRRALPPIPPVSRPSVIPGAARGGEMGKPGIMPRDKYGQPPGIPRGVQALYDDAPPGYIALHVARIARARGFVVGGSGKHRGRVNVSALARATKLAPTTVGDYIRKPETVASVSLDTIARFCGALQVTPGDLFEFVPYQRETGAPAPPMGPAWGAPPVFFGGDEEEGEIGP